MWGLKSVASALVTVTGNGTSSHVRAGEVAGAALQAQSSLSGVMGPLGGEDFGESDSHRPSPGQRTHGRVCRFGDKALAGRQGGGPGLGLLK